MGMHDVRAQSRDRLDKAVPQRAKGGGETNGTRPAADRRPRARGCGGHHTAGSQGRYLDSVGRRLAGRIEANDVNVEPAAGEVRRPAPDVDALGIPDDAEANLGVVRWQRGMVV